METGFYVIILMLIFLKLMIWICVFYSRAQRRRIISQRGLIIIQGEVSPDQARDRDVIINREHLPGFVTGWLENPVVSNLPSYEEVEHTKSMEGKPPSYEQVMSSNMYQPGYNIQSAPNGLPPSTHSTVVDSATQSNSHI